VRSKLNPTEYAWATLQSIAQKDPKQVKVLVDDIKYPTLETDNIGYVLHLSAPKLLRQNLLTLHEMFFDNDPIGRAALWRMFRASVYHLCLHAAVTDYSIYREFASRFEANNAIFSVSMAEDYALRGYMRSRWPGLILDIAYANHMSATRFRDLAGETNLGTKIAANLLAFQLIGKPIVEVGPSLNQDLEVLHARLVDYSFDIAKMSSSIGPESSDSESIAKSMELKLEAARAIADLLQKYSTHLGNVESIPYMDNHGESTLFQNSSISAAPDSKGGTLRDALFELSVSMSENKIVENEQSVEIEAGSILGAWEHSRLTREKLVELHRGLDPETHFQEFVFPNEDYAEYVRTRAKFVGPIRNMIDQLRMVKSTNEEVAAQESGYVDIPTAIQVVASKSNRNDIFVRDVLDKKSESWALLIDSSKSLEGLSGQVREIAVCMTEVANELFGTPGSWGCYAFNERFSILKDFNERFTSENKGRIGGLQTGIKTYLPDAIRLAATRLKKVPDEIKVLLVVSDGFPLGYENIGDELVKTIEKVVQSGIQLVGLGIGSSAIAKYFKSNCIINGPADLMKNFVRTYYDLASSF
jgi:Cobalamin biosynthesis protein CobT VWA domain